MSDIYKIGGPSDTMIAGSCREIYVTYYLFLLNKKH